MKSLQEKVLQIVKNIPPGKVTTYGYIARAAGMQNGARMVGWILNRQKFNYTIPAHRVVNRQGILTGKMHFETPELMETLLKSEGVEIKNERVVNFEKHLWIPPYDHL